MFFGEELSKKDSGSRLEFAYWMTNLYNCTRTHIYTHINLHMFIDIAYFHKHGQYTLLLSTQTKLLFLKQFSFPSKLWKGGGGFWIQTATDNKERFSFNRQPTVAIQGKVAPTNEKVRSSNPQWSTLMLKSELFYTINDKLFSFFQMIGKSYRLVLRNHFN